MEFIPAARIFLAGVIVGLLVSWLWSLGSHPPVEPMQEHAATTTPASATSSASTSPAIDSSGSLLVDNQPAGSSVTVTNVSVPRGGAWLAVQELSNGAPGNILGAAWVPLSSSSVKISLLRATASGQQYAVVLYRDEGDRIFQISDERLDSTLKTFTAE